MSGQYSIGSHATKSENPDSMPAAARPTLTAKLSEMLATGLAQIQSLMTRILIRQWSDPLALLSIVLLSMLAAFALLPDGALSDEGFHWHQLSEYFAGRFGAVDSLTMYPGYHQAVYGLSELFSLESIPEVRYVSFALSILALLFFFLVARQDDKVGCYPTSLQLFLSPLIFPFFFLLYTDIPALAMVMASLWLVTTRHYQLAALVVGISLLVRQTNIVWLAMLWVLSLVNLGFFIFPQADIAGTFRKWLACLYRTSLFALFCLLFAVFLYVNGGVAIGDPGSHQVGLYPTQVFFLLFVLFFLFIPLHIANFRKIVNLLATEPLLPLAGVVLFAVYIFTFYAGHSYNTQESDYFLRNIFLEHVRHSFLAKTLTFIPIIIAFFSIIATPLKKPGYYWLYPFIFACLLPVELIEPRYFIIPIVLFMLFRKPLGRRFEYLQATIYVPFTVYLFEGIAQNRFFP